MKSKILTLAFFGFSITQTADAASQLNCKFNAEEKSSIGVSVDESTKTTDTVLIGINATQPGGTIKSALLAKGSLAKQIASGTVIIAFAEDANPEASEVYDGSVLAGSSVVKITIK